jgi:hypothetical protein
VELGVEKCQEFVEGEEGFVMSKPLLFVILEEGMDKGLGLEEGIKGEEEVLFERNPSWVLA